MLRRLLLLATSSAALAAPLPERVSFNQHIRPILSDRCFYCHGPDEKTREADLRLDVFEAAIKDLGGYAAIVPGKPDKSSLIERIETHDKDDIMPPPKAKKPAITADEAALIRRWIEQGAKYESHWAFLPLGKNTPPTVKDEAWVKNPVDRFIGAKLDAANVKPSPQADPATLIRRVSLDLTGLLPTPAEAEAFVQSSKAGQSDAAYSALVDRLLASPHYGERWGRHWLDQARYADSNGYAPDGERTMWPYRDWVIAAHNRDLPFDQFTIEQLAGDLLPKPTKSQLVATAFHRNTLINEEGGSSPEQFRVEAVLDRVNTTGAVWLGLTVGCAQCHTHKFDPISHREYYQLYAFFNSTDDVNNKGTTISVARGEMFGNNAAPALVENADKHRADWERKEKARLEALAATQKNPPAVWTQARPSEFDSESNSGIRQLDDGSLLADGQGSANDVYRISAPATAPVAAIRLRVLTHESLPRSGPGWAGNGNFVLTQVDVLEDETAIPVAVATADHEQPGHAAAAAVDNNPRTGWAINIAKGGPGKLNANHELILTLARPIAAGKTVNIRLRHEMNERYLIGRFAFDFSPNVPRASDWTDEQAKLLAALGNPMNKRFGPGEAERVNAAYEKAFPKKQPKADAADLMIMHELAQPRPTFLFQRGDFLRPDEKLGPLQPGVLSCVGENQPVKNRLDLAKWLVSGKNPLVPRVTVNRIWMRYFGRGLVETEEDFGTQGSLPTHPELLDWLAGEFIKNGWSMKKLHRLIVTSATYRQTSSARPDLAERDPRNLLLARQERLRFESEIIRDAALAASGLLDKSIGGPGAKPPQPDGVYSFTQNKKQWTPDTGPARFRRGLYTVFYRSAPHPLFGTFDTPDMQTTCTRRIRSNTPLQALFTANDAAWIEFAQALATRLANEGGSDLDSRLRHGFRLTLGRSPTDIELTTLRRFVESQRASFADDPTAAPSIIPSTLKALPPAEAAALVCAARVLLNLDAFITRE